MPLARAGVQGHLLGIDTIHRPLPSNWLLARGPFKGAGSEEAMFWLGSHKTRPHYTWTPLALRLTLTYAAIMFVRCTGPSKPEALGLGEPSW